MGVAFSVGQLGGGRTLLGILLPYAAFLVFLVGITIRLLRWASAPVPFHIPTTCGQQKSLPWVKTARLESPPNKLWVGARMALEILLFRSLFRNTRTELREGPRLLYSEEKFLWLGALMFHWSLLIILLRHLRFFAEPIPRFVFGLQKVDGFFEVGVPPLLITDVLMIGAVLFLLQRRFRNPQVRFISLFTDYFALFLLLGVAISGVFMRHFTKVDLEGVKRLAVGLATFSPVVPDGVGPLFFIHLTLVSVLLAYFPFSKLVHMGGIFLSPTRNLANNSRMERHVNPWDYPVKTHTYEEWEAEFHDKIKAAGLPLERE